MPNMAKAPGNSNERKTSYREGAQSTVEERHARQINCPSVCDKGADKTQEAREGEVTLRWCSQKGFPEEVAVEVLKAEEMFAR